MAKINYTSDRFDTSCRPFANIHSLSFVYDPIIKRNISVIHSHRCKLTEDIVEEIYIELREGTVSQDIADMFNVSRGLVDHVNYGRSWPVTGVRYPIRKRNKPVKVLSHDEFPNEDYYPCREWEKRYG